MYNDNWWSEYKQFLKSAEWQAVRRTVFKFYGKKCFCCSSHKTIQVHHLSYQNYKHPSIDEVRPLCALCHKQIKRDQKKTGYRGLRVLQYHMRNCSLRKQRKKS